MAENINQYENLKNNIYICKISIVISKVNLGSNLLFFLSHVFY